MKTSRSNYITRTSKTYYDINRITIEQKGIHYSLTISRSLELEIESGISTIEIIYHNPKIHEAPRKTIIEFAIPRPTEILFLYNNGRKHAIITIK